MNKTIKILVVLLMLTGCFQTEKSLLEDVTDYQYKSMVCESSCDALWTNLEDAKAKAEIAGISDERIFAAIKFGETKAERELSKAREVREKVALKQIEEFKNKCALEEKVVCEDRCCTKEEHDAAAAATEAAADAATAAADAAAPVVDAAADATAAAYAATEAAADAAPAAINFQPPIKIKQGMEYGQARKILIDSGWQAVNANRTPNGTPVCFLVATMQSFSYQNDVACKYNEIDACSGTGMGYCKMIFHDGNGGFLSVITSGGRPPEAVIDNWSKEDSFEANVIPLDEISNYEN